MKVLLNDWLEESFVRDMKSQYDDKDDLKVELPFWLNADEKSKKKADIDNRFEIIQRKTSYLKAQLNIESIETIPVMHTNSSFAIKLVMNDKFSLIYSGDCRPSQLLAKQGKDCDLLIHEATYPDHKISSVSFLKSNSTHQV